MSLLLSLLQQSSPKYHIQWESLERFSTISFLFKLHAPAYMHMQGKTLFIGLPLFQRKAGETWHLRMCI